MHVLNKLFSALQCKDIEKDDQTTIQITTEIYFGLSETSTKRTLLIYFRLNTNTAIHEALTAVIKNGDPFDTDAIDERVAELFMFDFEQSGIHLSESYVR